MKKSPNMSQELNIDIYTRTK